MLAQLSKHDNRLTLSVSGWGGAEYLLKIVGCECTVHANEFGVGRSFIN